MEARDVVLGLWLLPAVVFGAGDWLGGNAATRSPIVSRDGFVWFDSGGSGGTFGRGDIRSNIFSVDFASASRAYIASSGGTFVSDDGGVTFQRLLPAGPWRTVRLSPDRKTVWLSASVHGTPDAQLFTSVDEGASWQEVNPGYFRSIMDFALTPSGVYAMGWAYGVYHSPDGKAWQQLGFPGGRFFAGRVEVPDDETVYVIGSQQKQVVLMSRNASRGTWDRKPITGYADTIVYASSFPDRMNGWVGGSNGKVFRTRDGGDAWQEVSLPNGETRTLTALGFRDAEFGYAAVRNRQGIALYGTRDGGDAWHAVMNGEKQIHDIRFRNGKLYAVGTATGLSPNDLIVLER